MSFGGPVRSVQQVSSESGSDSDSDEDVTCNILQNNSDIGKQANAANEQQPTQSNCRKKYLRSNSVWSKVICEQQLTTSLSKVNSAQMKLQADVSHEKSAREQYETFADREVETYFVPKRMRLTGSRHSSESEHSGIRSQKKRHRRRKAEQKAIAASNAGPEPVISAKFGAISSAQVNVQSSSNTNHINQHPIATSPAIQLTEFEQQLAEKIAAALNEPKGGLMQRCVHVLGADLTMRLFESARQIEAEGGMLVVDKSRRRTPGGVFLFLIRNSGDVTRQQKAAIFEVDAADQRRNTKSTVLFNRLTKRQGRTRKRRHNSGGAGNRMMETDTVSGSKNFIGENSSAASSELEDSDRETDTNTNETADNEASPDVERELEEGEIE